MLPGVNTVWPSIGAPDPLPGPSDEYAGNAPGDFGYREPQIGVQIETAPGSGEFEPAERIDWREINRGMDGDDVTCKLMAGLDAEDLTAGGEIGERHFSHLLEQLSPDRLIRIAHSRGASAAVVLFEGYPQPLTISWSKRSESLQVSCLDKAQENCAIGFNQQITGRLMRWDPLARWVPGASDEVLVEALAPVFNAGGRPNRSADAYSFAVDATASHRVHLFVEDDAPGASYWRFVDCLRYLVFHHVLNVDDSPPMSVTEFLADTADLVDLEESPDDPDPLVRLITATVSDVSVQSQSVRQALVLLCDEARLHLEIALRNGGTPELPVVDHFLRVFAVLGDDDEEQPTPEREMIAPQVKDLPREAPFTDMAGRTAQDIALAGGVVQSALTIDKRSINRPLYFGGLKEFEVTLLLRPLWLPHAQLDDLADVEAEYIAKAYWGFEFAPTNVDPDTNEPNTIYHPKNKLFHTVRNVGRLWGFPDDHRLMDPDDPTDSPYARINWPASLYSPYNPLNQDELIYAHPWLGAGIADAANWVPRRRPFREMIGRRKESTVRTPIVWIHFHRSDPETALLWADGWLPLSGGYKVDDQRAAIYIDLDNLRYDAYLRAKPDEFYDEDNLLEAYIEGRLMLAVTCAIAGDERMYRDTAPKGGSSQRTRYQVLDHGFETFRVIKRSHNIFADRFVEDDHPEFSERDDTDRMERHGKRDAAVKVADTVSGSAEVFWLDDGFRVGDSVSGVEGLGLVFDPRPIVRRIQLVNVPGGGHRTVLHMTDMRHNPEVDAE